MTVKRDLKSIIRDRQTKTGESYTAARAHVMHERAKLLGLTERRDEIAKQNHVEAAVLAIVGKTAFVRVLGEQAITALRATGLKALAPGHVITVQLDRRWSMHGEQLASGRIEAARIDVAGLGLEPLPLEGGTVEDLREVYENYDDERDPYTALWRRFTAEPRATYEFDGIAWGAFSDSDDPDDNPTVRAVELREAGDIEHAYEFLTAALLRDLRCLDAHAHFGNWAFQRSPARAIVHFEIGMRIGELSLSERFDGVLPWSAIFNRPFLRCLHGYGLCLWRLGRFDEAKRVFEHNLALNPNDNQGVRFCWYDVCDGRSWADAQKLERKRERQIAKDVAARRAQLVAESNRRLN
jgi:tetratricopeptide (TPR) repeat protein